MTSYLEAFEPVEKTDTLVYRERRGTNLSSVDRLEADTDLFAELDLLGQAHGGLFVVHYLSGSTVTLSYPQGIVHTDKVMPEKVAKPASAAERELAEKALAERATLPNGLPKWSLEPVAG